VSPVDIVLVPPEKLSIEVNSSGGYFRHAWYKNDEEMYPNGDTKFLQQNPERFSGSTNFIPLYQAALYVAFFPSLMDWVLRKRAKVT